MEKYSEKLFLQDLDGVNCMFLDSTSWKNEETDKSQYVLLETQDPTPFFTSATELHIYRWNREYLSDISFPLEELEKPHWKRISQEKFKGSSHECITYEVYVR